MEKYFYWAIDWDHSNYVSIYQEAMWTYMKCKKMHIHFKAKNYIHYFITLKFTHQESYRQWNEISFLFLFIEVLESTKQNITWTIFNWNWLCEIHRTETRKWSYPKKIHHLLRIPQRQLNNSHRNEHNQIEIISL